MAQRSGWEQLIANLGSAGGEVVSGRSERIFAWVWRVNALLLLFLGLVGVGAAGIGLFNIARFASRDRPEQQLTQIAGTDLGSQDLHLGDFRAIAGTGFLYAPLASSSKYIGSGSAGGLGPSRNLLFFDTTSKKRVGFSKGMTNRSRRSPS